MSQHPLSFVYMDKRNIQVFIMGVDANQTWTLTFIRPGWKRFSMPSGGEEDSIWRESKIRLTLLFMLRPRQVFNSSCKTQNSGLRSKEEKPRDPINQPTSCNTQEGLLSVEQTGDSDLLGGRAHRTANWASFLYAKSHTISILHTGYKVIGYTFAKQSYWYKLRGPLFKLKAILLVQTARAFVQT